MITNRGRTVPEIAQQHFARGVDGRGRFRNAQLDGREIRHAIVVAGHRAAGDPPRCHGKIVFQGAGSRADRGRGQAGGDVRQHRNREGGVGGIERGTRRLSGRGVGERQQAVRGHEHVIQHQRLAAGAAEADDIPGVVDDVVGSRDQQEGRRKLAAVGLRRQ